MSDVLVTTSTPVSVDVTTTETGVDVAVTTASPVSVTVAPGLTVAAVLSDAGFLAAVKAILFASVAAGTGISLDSTSGTLVITNTGGGTGPVTGLTGHPMGLSLVFTYSS